MKRIALGLLFLAFSAGAHAQQTYCVNFVDFCDGLEVNIEPGVGIKTTWQNYDCTGVDAEMTASIPQGGGQFRFICSGSDCATAQVFGYDVIVLDLDVPQGITTLLGIVGGQLLLNVSATSAVAPGACPFAPQADGGQSLLSTLR
jgi:hypothetical protein